MKKKLSRNNVDIYFHSKYEKMVEYPFVFIINKAFYLSHETKHKNIFISLSSLVILEEN